MVGDFIQVTPIRIRRCKNGHEWVDAKKPYTLAYVPMSVRVENARKEVQEVLSALQEADTMLRDCANYLTAAEQAKEGLIGCLYKIRAIIKKYGG